jgi:hypothetical protein
VQRREQERAAGKKERRIRQRERWEQRDEEFRLREQQGLSPAATSEYSSSEEEEERESDGGRLPLRGGSLCPPRRESRMRQRSKGLGPAWKGQHALQRHRRAPRRHLGEL